MITIEQLSDFLSEEVMSSRSGISIDYVPSVDGEPKGFRFMRFHDIGEPKPTVLAAIEDAMRRLR